MLISVNVTCFSLHLGTPLNYSFNRALLCEKSIFTGVSLFIFYETIILVLCFAIYFIIFGNFINSMISYSFPPIIDNFAKILILGTMPGKKSLEKQEYYGYKHNAFWKIMFKLFEKQYSDDYKNKIQLLNDCNIAIWDTLQFCERNGSLDSAIKNEIPNNFNELFLKFPQIKHLFFNGKSSFNYFKKYIGLNQNFIYHTLPSSSPAYAGLNFESKLNYWAIIKTVLNETPM
jgi:hypoxanthine-DNA glycosylase